MTNRLIDSTSPYLRQHAQNPVDWFEWGDEAFAAAKTRSLPILLSVGYSACHWCHVMAHESFEDEVTAVMMNERFINIKVDREERPDVDSIYMDAVTAMTGHGGWPMTVFLTPEGAPFYAGTYFPNVRRPGIPAFGDVLVAVSDAWRVRPDEVTSQAETVVRRLDELKRETALGQPDTPTSDDVAAALETLTRQYDFARGGFGGAPKFPPSMVIEFLLRHHARAGSSDALLMAEGTMRAMATGGMYDQLGGGFARYSVDANWVVPHFEKMLYDNALLARTALHLWRSTGRPLGRRIAEETADFMVRELRTDEGGFSSALDADTDGVEGRFYVWNRAQLVDALGDDDALWASAFFSVTDEGTFDDGDSTLQRRTEPDDPDRLERVRTGLLAARDTRTRPARDDKVVASWNGLAIAALAEIGALLDRPDLVEAAGSAAELLLALHVVDGRLRRVSRAGVVGNPSGVLEDYGNVADGLITLYAVTGEARWIDAAGDLVSAIATNFADGKGGLYDTAHYAEQLVRRPQDPGDNATPSGQAAAAGAMLAYAALSGDAELRQQAGVLLASTARMQQSSPRFAGWWLSVAEAWLAGPLEIAIVGRSGVARDRLHRVALSATSPGAVVAVGDPAAGASVALLAHRPAVGGSATAYVCRHFTCAAPTTDSNELELLLSGDSTRIAGEGRYP